MNIRNYIGIIENIGEYLKIWKDYATIKKFNFRRQVELKFFLFLSI